MGEFPLIAHAVWLWGVGSGLSLRETTVTNLVDIMSLYWYEENMSEKARVTITIDPELLEKVDLLADRMDLSRSQMIENLVTLALDDVKLLDSLGLLDLAIKLKAFRELFTRKVLLRQGGLFDEGS